MAICTKQWRLVITNSLRNDSIELNEFYEGFNSKLSPETASRDGFDLIQQATKMVQR